MTAYDEDRNAEALQLVEKCASSGEPVACYLAALWYRNGEGTAPNEAESRRWMGELERLAVDENPEAQWHLGQYLRFGDVFPLDIDRANVWLERAANNGWGEAQHHLAWYLESGQYGYAQDIEASEHWYQRALVSGNPETLYKFALREFKDGKITEAAISLLKAAHLKGFLQAEHVLRAYTQ